jgi:hypothetical protein
MVTAPTPHSQHGLANPLWPLGQAGCARVWAGLGPPLFRHFFFFFLFIQISFLVKFLENSSKVQIFLENKVKLGKIQNKFL